MKITIEFKTDNAAFKENPNEKIDCINHAMNRVKHCVLNQFDDWSTIWDSNGNNIGFWEVSGNEEE